MCLCFNEIIYSAGVGHLMNERDIIGLDGIELGGIVVLYGSWAKNERLRRSDIGIYSMLQPGLICI